MKLRQLFSVRPLSDLDPSGHPGIGIGNHAGLPVSIHRQPFTYDSVVPEPTSVVPLGSVVGLLAIARRKDRQSARRRTPVKRFCVPLVVLTALFVIPGKANSAAILLQDNFDDGDNVGWVTTVGNWTAVSGHNEAIIDISGTGAYTYAGDPSWANYTFDVDITFGTGITEFYVAVRADQTSTLRVDGGRQYYLSVDGDNDIIRLRYTTEPTGFFDIQTTSYTLLDQTTYHMKITTLANRLWASIDGNPLFDYAFDGPEPIYTNGLVGIGYGGGDEGSDGAYFDNVIVTAVPEPTSMVLLVSAVGLLAVGRRIAL